MANVLKLFTYGFRNKGINNQLGFWLLYVGVLTILSLKDYPYPN